MPPKITCPNCKAIRNPGDTECPNCGIIYAKAEKRLKQKKIAAAAKQQTEPHRNVGFVLGFGIFIFPFICSWMTLRKGYSTTARLISFFWLLIGVVSFLAGASSGVRQEYNAAKANNGIPQHYQNQASPPPLTIQAPLPLKLQSFSCYNEYNYFHITGEITNTSPQSIKNVMAVGSAYTEDDTFVKSDSTLIEYNPILPGQTSPFEVMVTTNPAITNCRVSFKTMFGGTLGFSRD